MSEITKNYKEHQKTIGELSVTAIVKAVDYINQLSTFIPAENEVLDDLADIIEPLEDVIKKCITNKECPHCGTYLFKSDLPQYEYVCADCDENFFECEA